MVFSSWSQGAGIFWVFFCFLFLFLFPFVFFGHIAKFWQKKETRTSKKKKKKKKLLKSFQIFFLSSFILIDWFIFFYFGSFFFFQTEIELFWRRARHNATKRIPVFRSPRRLLLEFNCPFGKGAQGSDFWKRNKNHQKNNKQMYRDSWLRFTSWDSVNSWAFDF